MQIVTTHKNTDFDGLASILAATLLYPGIIAVCPKSVNPNVKRFLALHKTSFNVILPKEVDLDQVERLVVVDTNQWRRLDRINNLKDKKDLEILLYDHHMGIGDINSHWQKVDKVGATITLFVEEFLAREITLSPLEATVFLLGLYEDTGQLTFSSTTARDAHCAAFLLEQGADLTLVVEFLNMAYGETQKKILFRLLRDAELIEIHGHTVGLGVVRVDKHAELAMVVQLYTKIANADAVFVVFINNDGGLFIIGRSGVSEINVARVVEHFGGGGHPGAGSAVLRSGNKAPGEVRQEIIQLLESDQVGQAYVADMMSFPVETVTGDTSMEEVQALMEREKIRGVVVADESGIEGIVVLWDFKKLKTKRQWQSPVKAFMTREVICVDPGMLASEAAELMVEKNVGHLPVVQEDKVIGIVTRTDVINYLYGMLPE